MIKYNPNRPDSETVNIVGVIKPSYPIFGVYFDSNIGKIYTRPVMFFAVRDFKNFSGVATSDLNVYPVCFSSNLKEMVEETSNCNPETNFLGLTEEPDPKNETWASQVRELKKVKK